MLGERAADMKYPSKLFHRKLSALDDDQFLKGNLGDVPKSKNVINQCAYEFRKANREDDSLITSLKLLKVKFSEKLKEGAISGFIQFMSCDPLTVGLWCKKDIEFYHKMSKSHSMLVDATGSVSLKVNNKEILYFSFLFYDRAVKTEPVPHLEILTDRASTATLKYLLSLFLEDEDKVYGYNPHDVPILCTTDCSWPILKSLIECFNSEKLEEYVTRSYKIVSNKAEQNDLPINPTKSFFHISLCHSMKAFSVRINKTFPRERNFIKFVMSLLANSGCLKDLFELLNNFFSILLSKFAKNCAKQKQFLETKMENIESFKEETLFNNPYSDTEHDEVCDISEESKLPEKEEIYLQQSKRSVYYKKCYII